MANDVRSLGIGCVTDWLCTIALEVVEATRSTVVSTDEDFYKVNAAGS